MTAISLAALQRRFDILAIEQLRLNAAALSAENDALRDRLAFAEDNADIWWNEAMELHQRLADALGGERGITPDGELVVASNVEGAPA